MRTLSLCLLVVAVSIGATGCGSSSREVSQKLQARLASNGGEVGSVQGERLLQPTAVAKFYQAHKYERAWPKPEEVIEAIRGVAADGLDPADYHLQKLESLEEQRKKAPSPALDADLDLLSSDAMAEIVDDVRYGRVRPASLDPRWNVDPREEAPPLEKRLADAVAAGSASKAIEAARPQHFIYRGLLGALGQLKELNEKGGWPAVPDGKPIQPGAQDARILVVRQRLAASGELGSAGDSPIYDPDLVKAVKLFQARHRMDETGVIDKATIGAMNVSTRERLQQVRVNLERSRWVLNDLAEDFLLVNLPAFKVYLIRNGKNEWETRSQVGKEARQTPTFRATMSTIVFNPDWTVPPTILEEDVLDGIRKGEDVIAQKHLKVYDAENKEVDPSSIDWASATRENFRYTLRQPPGDDNALGQVKFLFPNKHSIYLHDTPHRELFAADKRTFSSGCIRIEKPLDLAEILLRGQDGWNRQKIEQVVAGDEMQNVELEHKLPVLIVYWTVSVGASGEIRYMQDFYGLDPAVAAALDAGPRRAANS
jgi:murein L,D-transpeptidase YcbB/YkuD